MTARVWPCHFCGQLMPMEESQFYRLLPAGFADCGECFNDWGITFQNTRRKVIGGWLRRREESAQKPPPAFTTDQIPLENSLLANAFSGVVAKAKETHAGRAISDLLLQFAVAGVDLLQAIEWGRVSWLPEITHPDSHDPLLKDADSQWWPFLNMDRALLGLHGLFVGYSVLAFCRQRATADGKDPLASLYIDRIFSGDADQFAGVILPLFHAAGQRLYWTFKDQPEEVNKALLENVALVFQHPLSERTVTSAVGAAEHGLVLKTEESGVGGWVAIQLLFSKTFVALTDRIIEQAPP